MFRKVSDEKITWEYIKVLANSLTEEQLKQPVRYWTEDDGGKIGDANTLDEDYVLDMQDESYKPKSCVNDEFINTESPIMPKGTVMLWIL